MPPGRECRDTSAIERSKSSLPLHEAVRFGLTPGAQCRDLRRRQACVAMHQAVLPWRHFSARCQLAHLVQQVRAIEFVVLHPPRQIELSTSILHITLDEM